MLRRILGKKPPKNNEEGGEGGTELCTINHLDEGKMADGLTNCLPSTLTVPIARCESDVEEDEDSSESSDEENVKVKQQFVYFLTPLLSRIKCTVVYHYHIFYGEKTTISYAT